MKKLFALLLVFMLACAASVSGLAEETTQIVDAGGTVYYDANGNKLTNATSLGGDAVVEMSKTIEQYVPNGGDPVENEFVVTLNVKTQQKLLEISSDTPDSAVLLVMDVSNSMDDCVLCGKEESHSDHQGESEVHYYCNGSSGTEYMYISNRNRRCRHCDRYQNEHNEVRTVTSAKCAYISRLERTQTAAEDFLSEFANETGAQDDDKRMVGIVAYGSHAVNVLGYGENDTTNWADIRTEAGMTAVMDAIDGLSVANTNYPDSLEGGGTSIESAMTLARNILNVGAAFGGEINGIDYVYTILLTDGQPTYAVDNINSTSVEYIYGDTDNTGSATNTKDYNDAGTLAEAIRSLNNNGLSKLYSICFGKKDGDPVWELKVIGNDTVGEWLTSFSTAAYNAEAAQDANLFDAFNSVMSQIQLAAKAWKVEDWMGEHMIMGEAVTDGLKNTEGGSLHNAIDFAPDAANYADGDVPAFVWDILGSEPDSSSDYNKELQEGTLSYTYKYRVTLDNLPSTYTAGTSADVNKLAQLKYIVLDGVSEDIVVAPFAEPKVKGLEGSFAFTKWLETEGEGYELGEGIQFKLSHIARPDVWTRTATTDANGVVTFEDIPSGHDYVLTEMTVMPNHLFPGGVQVDIDFGNTTTKINSQNQTKLVDFLSPSSNEDKYEVKPDGKLDLVNPRVDQEPAQVTITKEFSSTDPEAPQRVVVRIYRAANADQHLDEVFDYHVLTAASPSWTFNVRPGYEYIISEAPGVEGWNHAVSASITVNGKTDTLKVTTPSAIKKQESETVDFTHDVMFTAEAGAEIGLTLKNAYTRKTGTLTLEKVFEGLAQDVATSGKQITVTATQVADANGTVLTGAKTYTLPFTYDNGKYTTSATLPIGYYKLEETVIPSIDGYTLLHVVFKVGTTSLGRTPVIEIKEGSAAALALTVTNHYEQDRGDIHVFKVFGGSLAQGTKSDEEYKAFLEEQLGDLEIVINVKQGEKVVGTMTMSADTDWAAELNDLPTGEYTLEEDTTNLDIKKYNLTGHNWSVTGNKVTVTKDDIVRATVTNHYDEAMTELVVQKKFEYGQDMTDATFANKTIYVYVVQDDGNPDTYDVKDTLELNAANGWKASAVLPVGKYQLYEAISPTNSNSAYVPGYTLVTEWTIGTQKISGNIAEIVLADHNQQETPTVNVGLKNTYTVNNGTLTLAKKNIGDATKVPESIVFKIVNVNNASDTRTVELNGQNSWGKSISLTPGTYMVTEVVAQGANPAMISWSGNVTGTTENSATVTITIGVNTVVDVVCENNYYYQHKLTFKKLDIATDQPIAGVKFTLTHTANCCEFDIAAKEATSDSKGVVTFENVLGPHTYVLTETTPSNYAAIAPMTVIATEKGVSITGITNGIVNNVPVKWPTTTLSFTKISSFTNAPLSGVEFALTHNKAGCEGGYHDGGEDVPMKAVSGANGLVSFSGIETGHTYTLKETKTPAGYNTIGALTVAVSQDGTITVTDENQNKVDLNGKTLENELTTWPTVNLGFAKYSSYTNEPLANVDFTLTHSAACTGCTDDSVAAMTVKSGVNGSVWLANIPVGHTYILSETSISTGYKPVADMTVVVAKDKTITVKDAKGATISLQNGILYNDLKEWPTTPLTFTKLSSYDHAVIAGAKFDLVHDASCCQTEIDLAPVESNMYGEVTIANIPQNHAYTLKEIAAPDGYKTMKDMLVKVDADGKILVDANPIPQTGLIVYNDLKIIPATLTLGAAKTMDGATPKDRYTFILSHEGTEIDRVQNVGGEVNFSAILFTAEGKSTFTITEEIGDDAKVLYDKSVYTVTVTAKKGANDILDLDIVIDKDGNTHNGAIEFHNETMQELPETGDNSKLGLWLALLAMASLGFVALAKRKAVRG